MRPVAIVLLMATACVTDDNEPGADSSVQWEELDEDDLFSDDKDTGKPDEYELCGDEVVAEEACEGDWTETTCIDEYGTYWWCEAGVWTSDKDE